MSAAISHVKPAQSCKAEEEVNTKAVEESAMFKGMRAHWTADNDCQFVTTLARHTVCNERQGLILNHKYIDQVVVKDIATGLDNNVSIDDLVHELAQKYPTKKEEHRSHECIELITELRKKLPQFGYEQLNHKHINMWTRTIVPFRQLFDAGTLFRGKPMVHKDCKRFTKAIMDFLANIITNGVTNIDTNMFLKKDDKSGKLLEQWLTAMLVVHGQAMVRFLYVCSVKLAVSFIDSKRVGERTPEDAWFLEAANHTPQQVELVLKEYMTHIIRNEALDSISDKVLVSEIIAMRNREAAQLAGRKNPQMHMADRAAFPPHLSQQQQPPRAPWPPALSQGRAPGPAATAEAAAIANSRRRDEYRRAAAAMQRHHHPPHWDRPERRGYSPSERYDYPPLEHRDYMPSDDYRHPPTESYGYPPSEHYGRPDMHGADPRYYGHTSPHFQPPRQASRVAGYMPRSAHPPPSLPVHQNHHAQPGPVRGAYGYRRGDAGPDRAGYPHPAAHYPHHQARFNPYPKLQGQEPHLHHRPEPSQRMYGARVEPGQQPPGPAVYPAGQWPSSARELPAATRLTPHEQAQAAPEEHRRPMPMLYPDERQQPAQRHPSHPSQFSAAPSSAAGRDADHLAGAHANGSFDRERKLDTGISNTMVSSPENVRSAMSEVASSAPQTAVQEAMKMGSRSLSPSMLGSAGATETPEVARKPIAAPLDHRNGGGDPQAQGVSL